MRDIIAFHVLQKALVAALCKRPRSQLSLLCKCSEPLTLFERHYVSQAFLFYVIFPPRSLATLIISAVITHLGYYQDDKHGSAGHFVCYIHHNAQWYLLNDDKVSVVEEGIVLTSPWWLALYKKGADTFFSPFQLF